MNEESDVIYSQYITNKIPFVSFSIINHNRATIWREPRAEGGRFEPEARNRFIEFMDLTVTLPLLVRVPSPLHNDKAPPY
jgi:hypothetical protein